MSVRTRAVGVLTRVSMLYSDQQRRYSFTSLYLSICKQIQEPDPGFRMLFSYLVPISLFVTMEIVRWGGASQKGLRAEGFVHVSAQPFSSLKLRQTTQHIPQKCSRQAETWTSLSPWLE